MNLDSKITRYKFVLKDFNKKLAVESYNQIQNYGKKFLFYKKTPQYLTWLLKILCKI